MNEILELLPIPPERDFPVGQLEARREALVAVTRVEAGRQPIGRRMLRAARAHITKSWLAVLGIVALALALVATGFSGQQRPASRGAVAFLAVAGTAQIVAAFAPREGSMAGVVPLRR
jgi:peptidoglycan/LPS O-acetylase OafA/YrhL